MSRAETHVAITTHQQPVAQFMQSLISKGRCRCYCAGADAAAVPRRAGGGKFGGSTNKHPCPTPGCTGRVYPNQKQCTVCKSDVKALRAQKAQMQHAGKPSINPRNAIKKIKAKLLACASRCRGLHVAVVFKRPNVKKIVFQGDACCLSLLSSSC